MGGAGAPGARSHPIYPTHVCCLPSRAGGECDLRACFCALAVADMLGLDVAALVERSGVVQYIARCQTYEGGLGGEPGNEAHGGYTFCGLAALVIAQR